MIAMFGVKAFWTAARAPTKVKLVQDEAQLGLDLFPICIQQGWSVLYRRPQPIRRRGYRGSGQCSSSRKFGQLAICDFQYVLPPLTPPTPPPRHRRTKPTQMRATHTPSLLQCRRRQGSRWHGSRKRSTWPLSASTSSTIMLLPSCALANSMKRSSS